MKKDKRLHPVYGVIVFMVAADGYVMARRPRCEPKIIPKRTWDALPAAPQPTKGEG
jgi:hypothetical protein